MSGSFEERLRQERERMALDAREQAQRERQRLEDEARLQARREADAQAVLPALRDAVAALIASDRDSPAFFTERLQLEGRPWTEGQREGTTIPFPSASGPFFRRWELKRKGHRFQQRRTEATFAGWSVYGWAAQGRYGTVDIAPDATVTVTHMGASLPLEEALRRGVVGGHHDSSATFASNVGDLGSSFSWEIEVTELLDLVTTAIASYLARSA